MENPYFTYTFNSKHPTLLQLSDEELEELYLKISELAEKTVNEFLYERGAF